MFSNEEMIPICLSNLSPTPYVAIHFLYCIEARPLIYSVPNFRAAFRKYWSTSRLKHGASYHVELPIFPSSHSNAGFFRKQLTHLFHRLRKCPGVAILAVTGTSCLLQVLTTFVSSLPCQQNCASQGSDIAKVVASSMCKFHYSLLSIQSVPVSIGSEKYISAVAVAFTDRFKRACFYLFLQSVFMFR